MDRMMPSRFTSSGHHKSFRTENVGVSYGSHHGMAGQKAGVVIQEA